MGSGNQEAVEIRHLQIDSREFGEERDVTVILPPSYVGSRRRYPVLYLHDGSRDWFDKGRLRSVLRGMWLREEVPEFIVVMPEPMDRTREYKLHADHLDFVAREVVPWTDAQFRTRPRLDERAVHGVSLGGLVSVWLGLKYARVFGAAGGQGGAYWYGRQRVVREVKGLKRRVPTRFFLACGVDDGNLSDNRDLAEALEARGLTFRYEEVGGRHSWTCWSRTLPDALAYYFG